MIEKFDLTLLVYTDNNMSAEAFEESQRLGKLINDNPDNIEYHLERARFFVKHHDDIRVIVSYCHIIKYFDNNLTAYLELSEYFYSVNYCEWAMIVCTEGLKHHKNKKLQSLLDASTKGFIDIYQL